MRSARALWSHQLWVAKTIDLTLSEPPPGRSRWQTPQFPTELLVLPKIAGGNFGFPSGSAVCGQCGGHICSEACWCFFWAPSHRKGLKDWIRTCAWLQLIKIWCVTQIYSDQGMRKIKFWNLDSVLTEQFAQWRMSKVTKSGRVCRPSLHLFSLLLQLWSFPSKLFLCLLSMESHGQGDTETWLDV